MALQWFHCQNFEVFDNGLILLTSDGIHSSQRGKRAFAQELVRLIDRDLN